MQNQNKETHVSDNFYPNIIRSNNLDDNIGCVEYWDFSRANLSYEHRVGHISYVASICYQSPKAMGSISLFNRLSAESKGLPSSSFEFVPVLLSNAKLSEFMVEENPSNMPSYIKYSEMLIMNGIEYILANYRSIVYDVEAGYLKPEALQFYNTIEECEIIKQHYKVFKYKTDLPTRAQLVRHRVNLQELSRRYVSGKKKEFEFYISPKLIDKAYKVSFNHENGSEGNFQQLDMSFNQLIDLSLQMYNAAIEDGVKPEAARRILPQAMYTELWAGFNNRQLDNFYKLRLDNSAQFEIRKLAEVMKALEN